MNSFPFSDRIDILIKRVMQRNMSGFFVNTLAFTGIIALYSLACSLLIQPSVNALFSADLLMIFSGLTVFSAVIFIAWKIFTRRMAFSLEKEFESFKLFDFLFVLVPMTPVIQYILANQDSLTVFSSAILFIVFGFISVISGVIIPVLLSKIASKKVTMIASLSFLCMILNMASLSSMNTWSDKGIFGIQLAVFALIMIIIAIIRFIPAKITVLAVTVFSAISIITGVMSKETEQQVDAKPTDTVSKSSVASILDGKNVKRKNDVLFLVFESYADNETLKYFGYDNSSISDFLKSSGFHLYQGIYSLGAPTEQSLSKAFQLDRDVPVHKKYLAGYGAVYSLLRKQGYKTHGVFESNWNMRGLPISQIQYDYCFPASSDVMDSQVLINAVFKGEFSDAVSFEGVDYNSYVKRKHQVIGKGFPDPIFLYSHSIYPGHSPSNKGMSLEEQPEKLAKYLGKIEKANDEIRKDVDEAIKNNPDAIVIIAGDHGPFMTKTGYGLGKGRGGYKPDDLDLYDIQNRFGMFLAIKWPDKKIADNYDIKILQDVFPAVLSFLFDDTSLFDKLRMKRMTKENHQTLGVYVEDGIIHGGKNDGQQLFIMNDQNNPQNTK